MTKAESDRLADNTRGWRYGRYVKSIPTSGYTCRDCVFDCPRAKRPRDGICGKFVPMIQTTPNVCGENPEREYQGGPTRDDF